MNYSLQATSTGDLSFRIGEISSLPAATSSAAIGALGTQDIRFRDFSLPAQHRNVVPAGRPTLSEQLFDATAAAKVWTSKVAMHLDRTARDRFFKQLDRLHDEDEWVGEDSPVNLESYKSLIRTFVSIGIKRGPSLALMPSGNLLAVWQSGTDRLSVEFLPGDRARWVLTIAHGPVVERAAGETSITRIQAVLAPYDPRRWLIGS
jgi:hypothetical protein